MKTGHSFEVHVENYLKAIFNISQSKNCTAVSNVKNSELANYLEIRRSSVTEMVKKLADKGFVHYQVRGEIQLSRKGVQKALKVVRKHRVVEQFLNTTLGISGAELHEEAELLEHAVSDNLLEKLQEFLRHPQFDPQGMPIPKKSESSFSDRSRKGIPIQKLKIRQKAMVCAIADHDPSAYKSLTRKGLVPGTVLQLSDESDGNEIQLILDSGKKIDIAEKVGEMIRVELLGTFDKTNRFVDEF